jgi:hypothetical protein
MDVGGLLHALAALLKGEKPLEHTQCCEGVFTERLPSKGRRTNCIENQLRDSCHYCVT